MAMLCNVFTGSAQVEKAKQSMMNIYKAYDSLKYLSFDVKYQYSTDTINGKFTQDELVGNYHMHGIKAVYTLGDIDFMQNDSFLIAVYKKEKFMIVSDPQLSVAGTVLPMRTMIDSLFKSAVANYTVAVNSKKNETVIAMLANDKKQSLNKFIIIYDNSNYYLLSLQYEFIEKSDETPDPMSEDLSDASSNTFRKKTLRIQFSNYKFNESSNNRYDEKQYIFYENNVYKPIEQYNEFKIYNSKYKK